MKRIIHSIAPGEHPALGTRLNCEHKRPKWCVGCHACGGLLETPPHWHATIFLSTPPQPMGSQVRPSGECLNLPLFIIDLTMEMEAMKIQSQINGLRTSSYDISILPTVNLIDIPHHLVI